MQCYGVHHDNQPIQECKVHQLNEFSHWDELHYCNGNIEGDEFTQVIYFIKVKDFKEVMNLVDLMNQIYVMISSCQWTDTRSYILSG